MKTQTRDIYIWKNENGWYVLAVHKTNPQAFPTLCLTINGWQEEGVRYLKTKHEATYLANMWLPYLVDIIPKTASQFHPQPGFQSAPIWPLIVVAIIIALCFLAIAIRIFQAVSNL